MDHTDWRKYDSSSGRWTSADPYNGSMTIADPQSFNRYSYVGNDPVNFIDPSGLIDIPFIHLPFGPFQMPTGSVTIYGSFSNGMIGGGGLFGGADMPLAEINDIEGAFAGGMDGIHEAVHTNNLQQQKKKCKQDPKGGDVPEILRYFEVYGITGLIDISTIQHSTIEGKVSEGLVFQLYDRDAAIAFLSNSPHFKNTHLGMEHNKQVGGKNIDFRGYTGNDPNKGSGAEKSLQLDIGPAGRVPDHPERAFGYADLDCDNPGQGPKHFLRHIFK